MKGIIILIALYVALCVVMVWDLIRQIRRK